MRFSIRYHADYRYSGRVHDQHNVLRVKPAATPAQRVRAFRLAVDPQARTRSYVDYFGTEVVEFHPTTDLAKTMEVVERNMAKLG